MRGVANHKLSSIPFACVYFQATQNSAKHVWKPPSLSLPKLMWNITQYKFSESFITRYRVFWKNRASLVAQWLRIHLPMQGTRVRALVREDPTCRGAAKPVHHNYWACALEPACHNYWAHALQLLKPTHLEPMLRNKRSHCNEKPAHRNEEQPPLATTRESPCAAMKSQHSQK